MILTIAIIHLQNFSSPKTESLSSLNNNSHSPLVLNPFFLSFSFFSSLSPFHPLQFWLQNRILCSPPLCTGIVMKTLALLSNLALWFYMQLNSALLALFTVASSILHKAFSTGDVYIPGFCGNTGEKKSVSLFKWLFLKKPKPWMWALLW